MKNKTFSIISLVAFVFLANVAMAHAATLFLSPPNLEVGVGEEIVLDIKIDGGGESFNAAQATINFPADLLEVVDLSKDGSTFSFWLEEPRFSNVDGTVSFLGGTSFGPSGSSVQILKVRFIAKNPGNGTISISDAEITAADWEGTKILSETADVSFNIIPTREVPSEPPSDSETIPPSPEIIPEPEQIIREPVPTGELPAKPVINILLYPDESQWYGFVSRFNVSWDLPADVTAVSTVINKNPNFNPQTSEGLFDNKIFPTLTDGVWYLHVRFLNDVGWGPTTSYRLAIDTEPPIGFELDALEGQEIDNPTPTLIFKTADALSGLKEYRIRINNESAIVIPADEFSGEFELPLQAPGEKRIIVRAVDMAGNSTESGIILEIVPIDSPTITFVPGELYSDEERGLAVKGTSLLNTDVLLKVFRGELLVAEGVARTDDRGTWEFVFDQPFRNGDYKVTAQSRDNRGALSLEVVSSPIKITNSPIVQIGAFQLGEVGAIIFLIIILILGFLGGIIFYKKRQEKLGMRVAFTKLEITKMFKLLREDANRLSGMANNQDDGDTKYITNRLKKNIDKMEGYIKKGVEKIKK